MIKTISSNRDEEESIGAYRGGRKQFVHNLIGSALHGFDEDAPRLEHTALLQKGRDEMHQTRGIRKKMEHDGVAKRSGAEMALGQLKELYNRATRAEGRARMVQSRYDGMVMEKESLEREVVQYRSKYATCVQEMAALELQLDLMKQRYPSTRKEEDTVHEEDEGHTTATTNDDDDDVGTMALARQISLLRAQLESKTTESADVSSRLDEANKSIESLQDENARLQEQLEEASCDAEAYRIQYQQARDALESMTAENASLSDALSHLEEELHELEISRATYKDDVHALQQHKKALEEQVHHSVTRIAHLEEQLTFMNGVFNDKEETRDADEVEDDAWDELRMELQEREQALASTQESLVEEKQRSSALHEQVLKQSMEIEDLRRDRARAQQLQHDLHALQSVHTETLDRLAHAQLHQATNDTPPHHLQEILDEKNATIMQLEGQLRQLQQNDSWLM